MTTKPSETNLDNASTPMASIINGGTGRILCISDIRGDFNKLNQMVKDANAVAVIHTGDFGFLDGGSPGRMAPRILRHILSYTPLLETSARPKFLQLPHGPELFKMLDPEPSKPTSFALSQLGQLLNGDIKLSVPVYTVYGPVEDVRVLEKFRTGEYEVNNLMILDEALTRSLEIGGIKLRLFGLGGGVMMHKIFDNGEGTATIAGGSGTVWATALQIGELVDTAERVYDPTETRLLVTHGALGRDGLLAQLSMVLKADLTVSGSLHFRFIGAFNEFGVQTDGESFRAKLLKSKNAFMDVYESAKVQLDNSIAADQKEFLQKAVQVAQKVPAMKGDEEDAFWKNCWNWSLSEAAYGHMVLTVKDGRVSSETYSQGLNFGYRRYQKAGRAVDAQASTQTANSSTPASSVHKPSVPTAPAQITRPIAQNRKNTPAETKVTTPQATSGSPTPAATATAPVVNVGPTAATPAQEKPASAVPAKAAEPAAASPIQPASTGQPPQSAARPERKTSNRFEKPEVKESPWNKNNGTDAGDRLAKKPRGKNPREKDVPEAARSPAARKEHNSKPEGAKQESDKENAPEVKEGAGSEKKAEGEDGLTRINGDRPARPPLNPHTLYLKNLPADITQDLLKSIWDEEIRAKITRIKIPLDAASQPKHFAYVEFGNDEDLQVALNKHKDELNGANIKVEISNPPAPGSYRGRGGFPRGSRTGGFNTRGSFRPGFNRPAAPAS